MLLQFDLTPRLAEALSRPLRLEIIHRDARVEEKLDRALELLTALKTQGDAMATDLTRLTTEVTENSSAIDSAVTLIEGLAEQIRQLATDPAALNALADQLDASSNRLAAAVQANTPAEEEPPTEEEPPAEEPVP
jgi:predicted  nucleic acid-binding Zn-ribbon protein